MLLLWHRLDVELVTSQTSYYAREQQDGERADYVINVSVGEEDLAALN